MDEYIAHKTYDEEGEVRTQTWKEHSEHTKELAREYGKSLHVSNLCELIAYLHDQGKLQEAFQNYITSATQDTKKRKRINHASAGAHYIMIMEDDEEGDLFTQLTKVIAAECVISHHGLKDFITPSGKNEFHRLSIKHHEQYDAVYKHMKELVDEEEIHHLYQKAKQEIADIFHKINHKNKSHEECYFDLSAFTRYTLSVLIHADREDTRAFMLGIPLQGKIDTDMIWKNAISNLEKLLATFPVDDDLNRAKTSIAEACKTFSTHRPGIYRLSCPTGSGKTLSSLRYALYHALEYKKKHIFYIAPYKSILTQNSAVIKSIFEESDVLEHHSNIVPEDKQTYAYLNSNWSTPVIMTTAEQFYQTLFSSNTTSIRRFHQLSDAIIILDEAQTIPLEMVSMFNYMMNFLSEICHSTVLLCTATQPLFDQTKRPLRLSEPKDIVTITSDIINTFQRVHLINKCRIGGYSIEEYAEFIIDCWREHACVLVVVNTKKDAANLYQRCVQIADEQKLEIEMYHLSTHMCPQHRIDKLAEIKEKTKIDKSLICISTNLIEAGVDMSFPCVIRSLTGLDSILQASGRCNRNKKISYGHVYIVNREPENIGKLKSVKEGKKTTFDMLYAMRKEVVDELLLPEKIAEYYERHYFNTDVNMDYEISTLGCTQIDLWAKNKIAATEASHKKHEYMPVLRSALKSAGENFKLISHTIGVLVPYKDRGKELISLFGSNSVCNTEKYDLLKEAQLYMIQLYEHTYQELVDAGVIATLEFGDMLVLRERYDDAMGLHIEQQLENLFL